VTPFVRSELSAGRQIVTLALHERTNTTLLASIRSKENTTVANRPVLLLNTNTPPTVSITSPVNGAALVRPTNLTINVTATEADGFITNVQFFADGLNLGNDTNSPFSLTWTNVPTGTFALTARATDDLGVTRTSAVVNITVATNLIAVADAHVVSDHAST